MAPELTSDLATFHRSQHVKYWLRCLKTHLPTPYQSNDASRMTLAFFILSALDLLDALHTHTSREEREAYVQWIYRCQHPRGGFRGFTGADLGPLRDEENECWDPANLAASYFALAALTILGDNLEKVKVAECMTWLRQVQLEDGSFGEAKAKEGHIVGGRDVRFCYCAAAVRWILKHDGASTAGATENDIDVGNLERFILSLQTFEGGLANTPFHEAHAGWTYCGIGALRLLDRLPLATKSNSNGHRATVPKFIANLTHWLVCRQVLDVQASEEPEFPDEEAPDPRPELASGVYPVQGGVIRPLAMACSGTSMLGTTSDELPWAGFNGRCNKKSDTCYSFWAGGSLAMLNQIHLVDFNANRQYLLEKTQHMIGGFGKLPGDPPDIMHSYLGLAALAAMREPGLKSLDSALCLSISAREQCAR